MFTKIYLSPQLPNRVANGQLATGKIAHSMLCSLSHLP